MTGAMERNFAPDLARRYALPNIACLILANSISWRPVPPGGGSDAIRSITSARVHHAAPAERPVFIAPAAISRVA